MPWKNYFCAEYPPRHTSLPSAHLRQTPHPFGIREEGLKGEEDLCYCVGYFKTRCFRGGEGGGEERIRGRGNKGERAWNAPPRYAVLIQPARKIDEPPDFLSNHRRSDTCSPIAQLFPPTSPRSLFAVALDTRASVLPVQDCTREFFFFWEARFLLREIFHDSFFSFFLFW